MGSPLIIQPIPMKAWEWVALAAVMSQLPHDNGIVERFQDKVQEALTTWAL